MRTCFIVCACVAATLVVVFCLTFIGDDPLIPAYEDEPFINDTKGPEELSASPNDAVIFRGKGKTCPPMHRPNIDGKCRLVMGAAIRGFAAGGVFVIAVAALMGFTIYRTRRGHPQQTAKEDLEGVEEPLREVVTKGELRRERGEQDLIGLANKQNVFVVPSKR